MAAMELNLQSRLRRFDRPLKALALARVLLALVVVRAAP